MTPRSFLVAVVLPLILVLLASIASSEQPVSVPVVRPVVRPVVVKPIPRELLVFSASWCQPCQRLKPAVVEIEATGVKVTRVDIDQHPDLARKYGVTSVPTMFVTVGNKTTRTQDIDEVRRLLKR